MSASSRSVTLFGWRFVAFAPKRVEILAPSFGAVGFLAFLGWLVNGGAR